MELIDVYQQTVKSDVIIITSFQLHLVIETLQKAYKKYPMDILKNLVNDLRAVYTAA